jgi:hypothetical protein
LRRKCTYVGQVNVTFDQIIISRFGEKPETVVISMGRLIKCRK